MCSDDRIKQAAQEIINYLQTNPNAADTVAGIAGWWISKQRLNESIDIVEQALAELERQGKIRKVEINKDLFLYSSVAETDSE